MGILYIVRHEQSIFNKQNRFAGFTDISLSKKGVEDAKKLGKKLKNINFNFIYSSKLLRAQETMLEIIHQNKFCENCIINHKDKKYDFKGKKIDKKLVQIFEVEELNERSYGILQGENRDEFKKRLGFRLLQIIRRNFKKKISNGESLFDVYKRVVPFFEKEILQKLKNKNKNILIVAHGNSLRALIKFIEKISDDEISKVEVAWHMIYRYEFDKKLNIKQKIFKK